MEIPVKAQVLCSDGICGRSEYVLINPVVEEVTHVVVRESASPHEEYIVPVDLVTETVEGTIKLGCSKADLQKLDPFIRTEVVEEHIPDTFVGAPGGYMGYEMGAYYYWPYAVPGGTIQVPVEHLQIPQGELAVRRGMPVEAKDGRIGRVDEFVVNQQGSHITHLIMREGHLWGSRDIIIPVSAIAETNEQAVVLKLTKQEIEALPTFQVKRRWA